MQHKEACLGPNPFQNMNGGQAVHRCELLLGPGGPPSLKMRALACKICWGLGVISKARGSGGGSSSDGESVSDSVFYSGFPYRS